MLQFYGQSLTMLWDATNFNNSASQRDRLGFTTVDRGSLTPNKDLNILMYRTLFYVIIYIIQKSKLFKMLFFSCI